MEFRMSCKKKPLRNIWILCCSCTQPHTGNQLVNTGTKLVPLPTRSSHTRHCSISLPVNQRQRTTEDVPGLAVIETGLILQTKILATAIQSICFYIVSSVIPFPAAANSFFFFSFWYELIWVLLTVEILTL